jgi:hypothetical protein
MTGVLAGYMLARAATRRNAYDAEIAGYENTLTERHQARHARRPVAPAPWELEAEARKSATPAPRPPARIGPIQGAWPRPSRVLIIAAGSQRGRWPLEDTGRMAALTDTGELRALETGNSAYIDAMRADNAAWLEAWAGAGA